MDTSEIIGALANCNYGQLKEIRAALDAKSAELKAAFIAQAAEMDCTCHDNGNGAPRKAKRKPKHADAS